MKSILSIILLVSALAFAACDHGMDRDSTTGMSDTQLEEAIKAKLNSDAQLSAIGLRVSADADRNEATLSGTVETQDMRTKAVQLAQTAHTGLVVTDKIDVEPKAEPKEVSRESYTEQMAREARERAAKSGDSIGASLDDAWIHTKIVAKLIGNSDTPQRKINVDVNNNVVTLRGTVDTAEEKTKAEQVAKGTDGVKQVINQLKVGKMAA